MKKVKINGVEIQYNSKNVHIVNSYQVKYKDDMIIILYMEDY